ncbi:MAG: hypothetical protein GY869_07010, partial [Planctomycetes bacterium]|nr:hypothetical protein [Planctomycetota bacterium]
MKKILILVIFFAMNYGNPVYAQDETPPIYIAFLWHMHQPIYWPYESIIETENNGYYDYSLIEIHNVRTGPYTDWPANAVQMGIEAGMPHFGAQVSFSGSLIENLNNLETAGNQNFQNWKSPWNSIINQTTSLGNPRLDMVAFGYHHPLMGLIDERDIRGQIQAHREIMADNFNGTYSRGIFPPENAFSVRMIKPLVEEGIEWVLVDNIHFERVCQGYPFNLGGNLYEPNQAGILNPDPGDWTQLTGLWAPTPVSVRWAHQPHHVESVDPATGEISQMIAVPASRYLGNEDGRGGFGALNYEGVMSQFESANIDSLHPILIVLHHDGDNHGGGTDAYYNYNFQNFVIWLQEHPDRFVCTTIQDYLDLFPPDEDDVIQVESGSWSGADNGDPEFKKWNGDPDSETGYSPDRNSWAVVTAAKNIVFTAEQIDPDHPATQLGRHYLLNAESSDYWYWDYAQNGIWDAHPTRGSNLAVEAALPVTQNGPNLTAPTIYLPQREPYNPGCTEWNIPQDQDFSIWTYVFDLDGLQSVELKYRFDLDGINSPQTTDNETYAGGSDVTAWETLPMTAQTIIPQTDPLPLFKADQYSAEVTGLTDVLVDYYVQAIDNSGNIGKSPLARTWIGHYSGSDTPYIMDGQLDATAQLLLSYADLSLYADWNGSELYVAAPSAQSLQNDGFI